MERGSVEIDYNGDECDGEVDVENKEITFITFFHSILNLQ